VLFRGKLIDARTRDAWSTQTMTKVKALSVLDCRAYVLEQFGEAGVERLKGRLSDQARTEIYAPELLAVDWLEVGLVVEHAIAVDETFGNGDGAVCSAMMRELTARHCRGLYRALMVVPTPQEVLQKSGRLWRRYYDRGETIVEFPEENRAIKRILGCPDLPKRHECVILPYYEELVRQGGGTDVRAQHLSCVATGAETCLTEVRWK
jgi:hypothetical protein